MQQVSHRHLTWVDIENPTDKDILFLRENFEIHPLAIEEFAMPTYSARATRYSNCLYMTIHIPLFDAVQRTTYAGEIDIILTATHVITGHQKPIYQITQFMEKLLAGEGARKLHMSKTPSHLLHEILEILVDSCFPRLDHITQNIDAIEEGIFSGNERQMVREISIAKRDVLNFRRTILPQRAILESITAQPGNIVAPDIKAYFQDLIGTNVRLWSMLESAKETIASLEETNNTLLSEKINSKMNFITIFTVIFIPMTLYANVLGINVTTPLSQHPQGFLIHLAVMVFLSLSTYLVFKKAKFL